MKRILECFDEQLADCVKAALNEAGVTYAETTDLEAFMTRWSLDIADSDEIEATAIIRSVADRIESSRSPLRCPNCGTGMLGVTPTDENQDEPRLYAEYRCPRCGTPGLLNIE
jgi:DNA-directed RNA polymerase subunit RPC12/RpoP